MSPSEFLAAWRKLQPPGYFLADAERIADALEAFLAGTPKPKTAGPRA